MAPALLLDARLTNHWLEPNARKITVRGSSRHSRSCAATGRNFERFPPDVSRLAFKVRGERREAGGWRLEETLNETPFHTFARSYLPTRVLNDNHRALRYRVAANLERYPPR